MRQTTLVLALLPIAATAAMAQGGQKDDVDPTQAYAISMPADWQASRSAVGDSGWSTEFKGAGEAYFGVMNFPAGNGTEQANLQQVADLLIGAVLSDLQQTVEVLSQETSKTQFGALDAVKCDLKCRSQQGATEVGYLLALLGRKNAFLLYVSAPENDPAGLKLVEGCLKTLALEATKPNAGGGGGALGQSLLTTSALAKAAQAIRGGLQRDEPGKVLVEGNPPLTYGSVVNFVQILTFAYDVELTETEFELVRQRFVECYPQLDDQGKMILAKGGESILSSLSKDDPEARAKQKTDIREQTLPVLARQAQQGVEYAVALWEAIQRRSNTVAEAQGAKPEFAEKGGFDSEMSEADLEAATEMLYFMWVASGRDPNLVTAEAAATVRAALVQNFAAFPPQVQYILANAQKVYSGMRGQWEQADLGTRAQLAAGYAQTLDAIGLGLPRQGGGGGGGGAWDDVKPEDMSTVRAEAMANSAFLSTNSWYNTSH